MRKKFKITHIFALFYGFLFLFVQARSEISVTYESPFFINIFSDAAYAQRRVHVNNRNIIISASNLRQPRCAHRRFVLIPLVYSREQ